MQDAAGATFEDGILGIDHGKDSLDKRETVHAIAVRRTNQARERFRSLPVPPGKRHVQDVISATDHADSKLIRMVHLPGQIIDKSDPITRRVSELGDVSRHQRHGARLGHSQRRDAGWGEFLEIEGAAGEDRREDAAMGREQKWLAH